MPIMHDVLGFNALKQGTDFVKTTTYVPDSSSQAISILHNAIKIDPNDFLKWRRCQEFLYKRQVAVVSLCMA